MHRPHSLFILDLNRLVDTFGIDAQQRHCNIVPNTNQFRKLHRRAHFLYFEWLHWAFENISYSHVISVSFVYSVPSNLKLLTDSKIKQSFIWTCLAMDNVLRANSCNIRQREWFKCTKCHHGILDQNNTWNSATTFTNQSGKKTLLIWK